MRTTPCKFSIVIAALIATTAILSGCEATKNTYRKVATDTRVTEDKKAIISPWVSLYFPPETRYVKGDTVVQYDTSYYYEYGNLPPDTVHRHDTITKVIEVKKLIKTTDTLFMTDGATLAAERRMRVQAEGTAIIARQKQEAAEANLKDSRKANRTLYIWIFGLVAVLLIIAYIEIRKLFV